MASSSSSSSPTPSLMDTLFQRSLDDLIKSLRHTNDSSFVISKTLEETRREIKSTDLHTKSIALQKLSYLHSLHFHDMSWASFHAVECISSSNFSHKRIGYHAISLSFQDSTPVILLISNQLRKDLKSNNVFEVSLALDCLARIGNVDLSRDLTPEVFTLMGSSKFFVKKKAIAVVLRVFDKYPDSVRVCFKRLVESLECSEPQIMCAVVGVFCELCSKEPRSYLPLAPEFYKVLVDSRNNWVLIKVLKIFAKLAPLEPRLAKRVVEPICDIMRRTGAKSLMFECIRTVVSSFAEFESAVKLAAEKIREFLIDEDLNLKYLGLHALSIMAPKHLSAVLEYKEVVIKSLSDADPNVKLESLRLVMAMVPDSNVVEICRVLVNYALKSDPEFCNEILGSILSTCSRNVYEIINDFDWYVSLLGEISRIPHCHKGEEIENQLVDIGMRVKDARPELVRVGRDLLIDPALLGNPFLHRILSAAAWVCGEYVEFSRNPIELIEALLQPRTSLLPPPVRSVYLQSAFKILIFCLYSFILQKEDGAGGMTSEMSMFTSKKESSDATRSRIPASDEHDEGFNPRQSNQSYGDLSAIDDGGFIQSPSSAIGEEKIFTDESIVNLLNLVELALGPLAGNYDVEIQERVQNVLGFVGLIKQEICDQDLPEESNLGREQVRSSEVVKLLYDAFVDEIGPVSVTAQDGVPLPEGLMLKESLSDLDEICGNVQLPSTSSFFIGSPCYEESFVSFSDLQSKEELEPSSESTSLLAEHRKRHGLYYLPSEKREIPTNDYPPANDPKSGISTNDDAAQDLVKLTDHAFMPKHKPSLSKPRPVVVKLDGDVAPVAVNKADTKDDLLTGAVREILLGGEVVSTSSQSNQYDKSSSKRKGKDKLNADFSDSKENVVDGKNPDHESRRKSKHRSSGKDRSKKSSGKNDDGEREENGEKEKHKKRHHHGKHKSRQRADGPISVVEQTAVVPDFLL